MFGKAYSSISKQSLKRHKDKLKSILSRSKAMSLEQRIIKLNQINIGWIDYYSIAKCKGVTVQLGRWIRQRLRMYVWKQWKRSK
ncbi:group II intron maturase-specific domain-containing protein [Clostridium sp.]|uniref:group II intron maturase-specific domain-containing protein n=1 Tax=Clostridium sp. TaxID=1506 RepID=UPI003992A936